MSDEKIQEDLYFVVDQNKPGLSFIMMSIFYHQQQLLCCKKSGWRVAHYTALWYKVVLPDWTAEATVNIRKAPYINVSEMRSKLLFFDISLSYY